MVISHLDYCSSVWNPYHKGDISGKSSETSNKNSPRVETLYHIATV